jgi:transposase
MLMNGLPASSPILEDAQRKEAERSEADWSAASSKIGAAAPPAPALRPDPEFTADAKRRTFPAAYKLRIVEEADAAVGDGMIGALLRREGLYSSLLSTWRRERQQGTLQSPRKRGPKAEPIDPRQQQLHQLQRDNDRLTGELQKAHLVIEVQKKVALLWEQQVGPEKKSS